MNRSIITIFFCLLFFNSYAGVLTVTGVYLGKNLYIQNPFSSDMKTFCVQEVYVNDIKIKVDIKSSAFEIDMDNLKLNDPVHLRIVHKDDCIPKVINPQVIKQNVAFQFLSLVIDESLIKFSTRGENPSAKLFVEQFYSNSWNTVKEVAVKGQGGVNIYQIEELHNTGVNKYRVKYFEKNGRVYYSKVAEFTSAKGPVTFYPKRVATKVFLSRPVYFEVMDQLNQIVKKGRGIEIDMGNLSEGLYYLHFDNRIEKVLKK